MSRPSWDPYFMSIASLVSRRSHDPDTQHGAVIVDAHHRVLGIGYNGFPRGGRDIYSINRPDKYRFMIHAEANAILNCTHRPDGAKLYVTGPPCCECMKLIIQSGIARVVYGMIESRMVDKDHWCNVRLMADNHDVLLEQMS